MSSPAYLPVIFPDAEKWAIDWLTAQIGSRPEAWAQNVFLSNEVPREGGRPPCMVILNSNGGTQRLEAADVTMRINVWAPDQQTVSALTACVQALLRVAWTDTATPVRAAEVQGALPVADETGGARRLFYAQLTFATT